MKTWKREKEKGRERNWKKESSRKGKGGFIVKERKHGIQSLTGGRSVGIREGDSSFLMLLLCSVLQTLSGLSQYKNLSPTYVYLWH